MIPISDINPAKSNPIISRIFIIGSIIVYVLIQPKNPSELFNFFYEFAAIPCEIYNNKPLSIEQYYNNDCSALTSNIVFKNKNIFLSLILSNIFHANFIHILGNLWSFWIFGNNIEDVLGRARFIIFLFMTGLFSMFAHVILNFNDINPIVVDIDDEKLAIAKEAGASAAINSNDEDAAMKIFEITGGGAKSVIDFVGAAPAFEFAYGLFGLVRGGTYVLVGLLGGQTTLQLPLVTLTARTLTGTYVGSLAEMGELMDLVRSGKIDPVPVEARNVSEADKTIKDLASGSINGLVCLKHDH